MARTRQIQTITAYQSGSNTSGNNEVIIPVRCRLRYIDFQVAAYCLAVAAADKQAWVHAYLGEYPAGFSSGTNYQFGLLAGTVGAIQTNANAGVALNMNKFCRIDRLVEARALIKVYFFVASNTNIYAWTTLGYEPL